MINLCRCHRGAPIPVHRGPSGLGALPLLWGPQSGACLDQSSPLWGLAGSGRRHAAGDPV